MASHMAYTFTFESMIHGYHGYKLIGGTLAVGEQLNCCHELGNSQDPYAIAVKKKVFKHIPWSAIRSLFIRRGGTILCMVAECSNTDLPQDGIEIMAKLTLTATSKEG